MQSPVVLTTDDVIDMSAAYMSPSQNPPLSPTSTDSTESETQIIEDSIKERPDGQERKVVTMAAIQKEPFDELYDVSSSPIPSFLVERKTIQSSSQLSVSCESEHTQDGNMVATTHETAATHTDIQCNLDNHNTQKSREAETLGAKLAAAGRLNQVDSRKTRPVKTSTRAPQADASIELLDSHKRKASHDLQNNKSCLRRSTRKKSIPESQTTARPAVSDHTRREHYLKEHEGEDRSIKDDTLQNGVAKGKDRIKPTVKPAVLKAKNKYGKNKSLSTSALGNARKSDALSTEDTTITPLQSSPPTKSMHHAHMTELVGDASKKSTVIASDNESLHSRGNPLKWSIDGDGSAMHSQEQNRNETPAGSVGKRPAGSKHLKGASHSRRPQDKHTEVSNIANDDEDALAGFGFIHESRNRANPTTTTTPQSPERVCHTLLNGLVNQNFAKSQRYVNGPQIQPDISPKLRSSQIAMPPPHRPFMVKTRGKKISSSTTHGDIQYNDVRPIATTMSAKINAGIPHTAQQSVRQAIGSSSIKIPSPNDCDDSGYQSAVRPRASLSVETQPRGTKRRLGQTKHMVRRISTEGSPLMLCSDTATQALMRDQPKEKQKAATVQDPSDDELPLTEHSGQQITTTYQAQHHDPHASNSPKRGANEHDPEAALPTTSTVMNILVPWRSSLQAHQRYLFDQLVKDAERLVSYLAHREELVQDLVDDYRRRGGDLVKEMEMSHAREYQRYCQERERAAVSSAQ